MPLPAAEGFADAHRALNQFVDKSRFFSLPENLAASAKAERR
jgi:hypothetical protein